VNRRSTAGISTACLRSPPLTAQHRPTPPNTAQHRRPPPPPAHLQQVRLLEGGLALALRSEDVEYLLHGVLRRRRPVITCQLVYSTITRLEISFITLVLLNYKYKLLEYIETLLILFCD
jgi:hypothetical protein